jgi:hypothetical protein
VRVRILKKKGGGRENRSFKHEEIEVEEEKQKEMEIAE